MKPAAGVTTLAQYVDTLPTERRAVIAVVRRMVNHYLPAGYEEMLLSGAIAWAIPLSRFPGTYNKQPLIYVALASQKNYCSLYLMGCYGDFGQLALLKRAFADAGKKLDMGKSCVRFESSDDLPLVEIGKLIAAVPPEKWIAIYEASRLMTKAGQAKAAKAAKKK